MESQHKLSAAEEQEQIKNGDILMIFLKRF